ncbi:hypothetical protein D9M68_591220 [compost metagenome]
MQACPRRPPDGLLFRPSALQQAGDLQPARRPRGRRNAAEMPAYRLQQRLPASRIELAHRTHVRVVVAIFHETRQRQLKDLRRVAVHDAARAGERAEQLLRQGHVSHPEARIERLAEGAQVDRPLVPVQALHARGRQAVVVEFAVVVVLDDPLAVRRGPAGQLQAARQRQRGARRILVRRRHIDAVGAAAVRLQQIGADAMSVDVDGDDPGLGGFERLPGAEVAGVLHQDGFACVRQQLRAQEQGLPRAAQDQDLRRGDLGPALQVQVGGNGLAQRLRALGIAVQQNAGAVILQHLALQALPDVDRKIPGLGQSGGERLDRLLVGDAAALQNRPSAPAQARPRLRRAAFRLRSCAPPRRPAQLDSHRVGHVAARALAADDVAIAMQLHIGVFDGIAGNAQRLCQHAGRGQLRTRLQRGVENQRAQRPLDALVQVQTQEIRVVQAHLQRLELECLCHAVCPIG